MKVNDGYTFFYHMAFSINAHLIEMFLKTYTEAT